MLKKKTEKKDKKIKNKLKPVVVQSTQKNIPVKEIVKGTIITTDNRYVKILEVKPIPFFMKNVSEQNAIYSNFSRLLKICQCDLQLKVVSLNADLTAQLENCNKDMAEEENENCFKIDEEYRDILLSQEAGGVTRRFFVSFYLDSKVIVGKRKKPYEIINQLEVIEDNIISYLKQCGNAVVVPKKDRANEYLAEILYILLNRNKYKNVPYDERVEKITAKYITETQSKDFYVPITDYIAPDEISFKDSRFVTIDGMYYRYGYIPSNGYNSYLSCGWINLFSNTYVGVDVDVYIKKVPKEQVIGNIRKNLSYAMVGADDASETSEAFDSANTVFISNQYLKDGLSAGQDFYYVSTLITVCDTNAEVVDSRMEELIKNAKASDFTLKGITYETEQAFKSTLPLCKEENVLFNKSKRNMLTETVATFYPFTAFEINDPKGIYFGNDANSGALVVPDIFDRDRVESSNTFVCGATGSGKTYTLSLLAERMRIRHIPAYIIAPEKQDEFRRLSVALGGEFVEIGTSAGAVINIMQIFKPDEEAIKKRERIDGMAKNKSLLDEKVGTVTSFIKLLVEMNREQEALLSEAIYDTYYKFGITQDNETLWKDDTKTVYKDMPILEDLQKTLGEKMNKEPSLRSIYNTMKFFVTGGGSMFNGQTNIDTNNDFIVFGLENLKGETASLGIFLVMDYCLSKIKEDSTVRKALFVDEWWKVAQNPIGAQFTMEMAKLIRALNGALILATQQLSDVFTLDGGKYGKQVIGNCPIRILMKMKETDAMTVQELLLLTDDERDNLVRNERGKALFVCGDNKVNIQFIASETEDRLINTNPEFLEKYAQEKAKIQENKAINKRIKNARDLSDVFVTSENYFGSDDIRLYSTEELNEMSFKDIPELMDTQKFMKRLRKNG